MIDIIELNKLMAPTVIINEERILRKLSDCPHFMAISEIWENMTMQVPTTDGFLGILEIINPAEHINGLLELWDGNRYFGFRYIKIVGAHTLEETGVYRHIKRMNRNIR